MSKRYYIYILSSYKKGTLYIGITNNLTRRIYEHKNKLIKGFTEKYIINNLVYFEIFESADFAIQREKQLKKYSREKKMELINKFNPEWDNLYYIL